MVNKTIHRSASFQELEEVSFKMMKKYSESPQKNCYEASSLKLVEQKDSKLRKISEYHEKDEQFSHGFRFDRHLGSGKFG